MADANCPMYLNHFDPQAPVWHDKPVNHTGIQARIQDLPAGCLWAQLQWEREEAERGASVSPEYLWPTWRPSGVDAISAPGACRTWITRS